MEQDWYNNKELYEMIDAFKKEVIALNVEMKETKVLIRDYNGLREVVNKINRKIANVEREMETYRNNKKEYIGYFIAAISILFYFLNYFK